MFAKKRSPKPPKPVITEKQLQTAVVSLAKALGWMVYHTHDSRRSEPGFPDLVLVRDRVLFVELKSAKGRVRPEQVAWMARLRAAGADVRVWRPENWTSGIVELTLRVSYRGDA